MANFFLNFCKWNYITNDDFKYKISGLFLIEYITHKESRELEFWMTFWLTVENENLLKPILSQIFLQLLVIKSRVLTFKM